MLWPKKNSYEEFDNEKKLLRLETSPPPSPITFLMVRPLYRGCCLFNRYVLKKKELIVRKYLQRFRDNNKGERRYKISVCKVCFSRKDKQRDRKPSPFGPYYTFFCSLRENAQ